MNPLHRLRTLLQEATYERDAAFRRQAVEYFNKLWPILDDLYRNGKRSEYAGKPWVRFGSSAKPNDVFQLFTWKIPDLNEHDLVVSIYRRVGYLPSGMYQEKSEVAPSHPELIVNSMTWSKKEIARRFVHEFIHHLDYQRHKSTVTLKYTSSSFQGSDYFNDPLEFNAFFQEAVANYENTLNDRLSKARSLSDLKMVRNDLGLTDFERFRKGFDRFSRRKKEYVNARYARKWDKRLVGVYRAFRDKWRAAWEEMEHAT